MSLVTMHEIAQHAFANGYTVGAFNVFNLETLLATVCAAEIENAPTILQIAMPVRHYVQHVPAFVNLLKEVANSTKVPIALNHDHCPTIETAMQAIDWGFSGVMFDGSNLPFEENITKTKMLVDYAHAHGVFVEAELGQLAGFEDEIFAEHTTFTDALQAQEFVTRTDCDALAVSVGTAHGGVLSDDYLPLSFAHLQEIHAALPHTPLVLHGAASLPEELIQQVNTWGGNVPIMRNCAEKDIAKCRTFGIYKANMDVDNFLCFTAELRKTLQTKSEIYNPRLYLAPARDAFSEEVRHKIQTVAHCSNKNWL